MKKRFFFLNFFKYKKSLFKVVDLILELLKLFKDDLLRFGNLITHSNENIMRKIRQKNHSDIFTNISIIFL